MFFLKNAATTGIYPLTPHGALPISPLPAAAPAPALRRARVPASRGVRRFPPSPVTRSPGRSEEHTSEFQSRQYLVCPLLLEKNFISQSSGSYDHTSKFHPPPYHAFP